MMSKKAYRIFGENIVWLRENTGLTEKEMADILGINRILLKIIEKGYIPRKVYLKVIFRLHDKLKLNIVTVFTESYKDMV